VVRGAGSVAFIIDIAGAKLRKVKLARPLSTRCCCLRSGAGVPSATLNPRNPREKGGALRSPPILPFFPTVFSSSAAVWPGELHVPRNMRGACAVAQRVVRIKRGFDYTGPFRGNEPSGRG
jgi:hypothetical protein